MFNIQEYFRANNLEEAVRLLKANPEAKVISGGTDVLVKLRHHDEKYQKLVDIHSLPELKKCAVNGTELFIGAGLTFSEAMDSDLIGKYIPVLGEASSTVAGPQIRNMGTIGGNIANGATSADTAAPMLVLEPRLLIQGSSGRREASISGFHTGPGQVALSADEVLIGFEFDLDRLKGLSAAYYKYAMRSAMDIATIGCAAGLKLENGRVMDLRLAFTVAAPTPVRCPAAEAIAVGQPLTDELLEKIKKALEEDIKPRTSWRASREFRTRIIKTLAERMIRAAARKASEGGERNADH